MQNQLFIEATKIVAVKEGLDEEAQITLANEIYNDAMKDEPETEDGKQAKINSLNAEVESPYAKLKTYDFDAHYDRTVTPSVAEVFSAIARFGISLSSTASKPSDELVARREKDINQLTIEVFNILNKNGVWMSHYPYLFKDLKSVIGDVESMVTRQTEGHTKEVLSRALGVRHPDPADNTFKSEFATYAELIAAREKIIQETGGKKEDYFNPNLKEY